MLANVYVCVCVKKKNQIGRTNMHTQEKNKASGLSATTISLTRGPSLSQTLIRDALFEIRAC